MSWNSFSNTECSICRLSSPGLPFVSRAFSCPAEILETKGTTDWHPKGTQSTYSAFGVRTIIPAHVQPRAACYQVVMSLREGLKAFPNPYSRQANRDEEARNLLPILIAWLTHHKEHATLHNPGNRFRMKRAIDVAPGGQYYERKWMILSEDKKKPQCTNMQGKGNGIMATPYRPSPRGK